MSEGNSTTDTEFAEKEGFLLFLTILLATLADTYVHAHLAN
jgi:hypothetical protein